MKDLELQIADDIAREWARAGTDPNEVSKVLSFLREEKDGRRFFLFLDTIVINGETVMRSKRTISYYRQIRDVCRQYLSPYQDKPKVMAQILGWAGRLTRYYAIEDKIGVPRSVRKPQPRFYPVGDRLTGTVQWFDGDRRYGFITPDGGGKDIFVHLSQVQGRQALRQRQRVSYVMGTGPKGKPQAQDVRPE